MLLNESRPYFIQRSYPMPTLSSSAASSTSATATNLARMAVLNQMDNNNGYDTPDRGTTPESRESSPAPASLPSLKKKRGFQKHRAVANNDDDMDSATTNNISRTGAKRKRGPHSFSAGSGSTATAVGGGSGGGGDDDGGDSSARSTPAPTPRPRPVPTRPRMYPCTFEGCGKSFMDKFHLKRHEKRHVTQVIVCGIDGCTKAYDSISTMRRHQSMIHKERKEEIAAAAAAVATTAASSDTENLKHSPRMVEEYGDEGEDYQSENSGSSPAPSSVTHTAVSSPMRD
ncbi:hypothetical protein EDD21DRAFT_101851 [Dissophora ornata]|nr:hypothetical protein EDD21DRAFT_101851 [Dissophora ornata]